MIWSYILKIKINQKTIYEKDICIQNNNEYTTDKSRIINITGEKIIENETINK